MLVAQEEISGPVVSVLTYSDDVEAIAIANNSRHGLNRSVSTVDLDQGLDVAARIRTGTVQLNGAPSGLSAPTGGIKGSGMAARTARTDWTRIPSRRRSVCRPPMRSSW
jgi:aldehyde dehydrogenase (NAD+)